VHVRTKCLISKKRFTVLKIVNRFSKIKETFTIKLKIIYVDHYFCLYQTQ